MSTHTHTYVHRYHTYVPTLNRIGSTCRSPHHPFFYDTPHTPPTTTILPNNNIMTMDPKPRPSKSDGESTPSSTLQSINKTNDVVSTTLHRTIQQHVRNKEYDAEKEGLDFVQAKNGLLLSYLVDLTLLLRCRLNRCNGDDQQQTRQEGECLARLNEMKAVLEKARPLEKRMRYQIDKLLALSTLGAGTFAAVGREEEEKEADAGSDDEEVGAEREEGLKNSDPLSFKPDLQGMMKMFEEDGDEVRHYIIIWIHQHELYACYLIDVI